MSWKDLHYWLRGGIIALIIYLLMLATYIPITFMVSPEKSGQAITPIEYILLSLSLPSFLFILPFYSIFSPIFGCFKFCPKFTEGIIFVLIGITYFLIGSFIGSLINKSKSKKKEILNHD